MEGVGEWWSEDGARVGVKVVVVVSRGESRELGRVEEVEGVALGWGLCGGGRKRWAGLLGLYGLGLGRVGRR